MADITPQEIVRELDKHIIGQDAAKRAVAIALRNRWRRLRVDPALRNEITPKNILMIGPTGVGKTEIARRLAKLADAPFLKVEATKFTEVGYVGRDVESIIRDLADAAVKMVREQEMAKVREPAALAAEERVLDVLLPEPQRDAWDADATPVRAIVTMPTAANPLGSVMPDEAKAGLFDLIWDGTSLREPAPDAGWAVTEQDRALYALCRPERLLDLALQFTVFDGGVRKVARYQQFFAVKRVLGNCLSVLTISCGDLFPFAATIRGGI